MRLFLELLEQPVLYPTAQCSTLSKDLKLDRIIASLRRKDPMADVV